MGSELHRFVAALSRTVEDQIGSYASPKIIMKQEELVQSRCIAIMCIFRWVHHCWGGITDITSFSSTCIRLPSGNWLVICGTATQYIYRRWDFEKEKMLFHIHWNLKAMTWKDGCALWSVSVSPLLSGLVPGNLQAMTWCGPAWVPLEVK